MAEHDFAGSHDSLKRHARWLGRPRPLPFRRMECEPGQEGQIDLGTAPSIVPAERRRRKMHVFLSAWENTFWNFGGVPRTTVIDNLKAAVAKADRCDPAPHPIIQSFGEHCGTVILPTKPYTPRHKGKAEIRA